jgi:cilia- and flagella-associated protein 57
MTVFAEFTSDCAVIITLHEWATKRRRRLVALDHGRSPVTHLCFTCDGRHLIVQTGAPEWTLHYVAWEKAAQGKVVATLKNVAPANKAVLHVDGHPIDAALIATSGRGFVRLFRLQDDTLKPVPINLRRDPGSFTCHAWLADDRLVLGTAAGELWLIEGTEFKRVLDSGPPSASKRACCIQAFAKGFIVGGESGSLRLFEKSEDARLVYKARKE